MPEAGVHRDADPFGWVGQEIDGKYRVDRVIGEGGFGVVYQGFHAGLRESIAVKCLKVPAGLGGAQRAQFEQTFMEEGRLLHRLSRMHAAIAQALDVGAATSPSGTWTPYLVLEWLEGRSLQEELQSRRAGGAARYSVAEAVELLGPALDALAEAHEQGIAHRDLKPPNLFLARVGGRTRTKVLDFGIAKVMGETMTLTRALEETGASIKAFTPQYGAPEQFDPKHGATGPWTDVFALALIFVELLTGKPALDGQDTIQLFVASANPQNRPTPNNRGVAVSAAVDAVIERALAVRPRDRYLSARAFAFDLHAAVTGRPQRTEVLSAPSTVLSPPSPSALGIPAPLPDGPTQLAPQPIAPSASTTSPQVGPSSVAAPKPRSHVGLILAALVLTPIALASLAGAAHVVLHDRMPAEEPSARDVASALPSASVASVASSDTDASPMIRVPPGTFEMGSNDGAASERPAHEVTITRPFYVDRTEVTVAEYMRCVHEGACSPPGLHGPGTSAEALAKLNPLCNALDQGRGAHPINCVDRVQAEKYCAFVRKRLPTEAEWEWAARGASSKTYPWGNSQPDCGRLAVERLDSMLCRSAKGRTEPVGSFPSNASPFAVLDMAGNVREWVADGYDPGAYRRGDVSDPQTRMTGGRKGIVRGGAWSSPLAEAASWRRVSVDPSVGDLSTGFRCARSVE